MVLFILGIIVILIAYESFARDWIIGLTVLAVLGLLITKEATIAAEFKKLGVNTG